MGQAIVYCSNCSAQLRSSDFDSRKAFKVDDLNFCAKCYLEVVGEEPPPAPPLTASSKNKIPAAAKPAHHHTSQIALATLPPPPDEGASLVMYIGLGVAVVAILIAVAAMSGGERRTVASAPAPGSSPVVVPSPVAPRPSARESSAEQSLAKALRTENLEARRELLAEAVAQSAGTPLFNDAQRELDRVERKLNEQRAAESARAAALIPRAPLVAPAPVPAPPTPAPAPTPVAPDRSREEAEALVRWETALSPATGRDYPAAIAGLEKLGTAAPDVALLKSVATLHQEALLALLRTPRGQKLSMEYRDSAGGARRVDASFMEAENGRVELRNESGVTEIELGEILPSSLADLLKSRGTAVDPATAAVYCLLEGDQAGARRLAGAATIPERYWTYGRKVGSSDPARALYYEAVALAAGFATAADAVPKFQALLRDHAGSSFVKRNKTSIAARGQQCARDFLFTAADLKPAGTFKSQKSAKGFVGWTSESDSEPAKMRENVIELSYSALADTPYKCWIYAGGCCQETFEFWVQGTEMKGGKDKEPVEPGSAAAANVKPWLSTLKKIHSGHTGPKQPTYWEWVAIPLPRYAKTGLQQLRVLTAQKGFSVAFACVTATRSAPPRELEMKELEKTRGAVPVAAPGLRETVLYRLALDGTDLHLMGEIREKALYGVPLFGASFAGYESSTAAFAVPAQGEFRMIYYLKASTPLKVRFRISRGPGKSDAHDAVVTNPVAGRPTEVRFPFSAFKPNGGLVMPPMAAGDPITMVYIFGDDVNCGLRIDALSVVELKAAEPVAAASSKLHYSENFNAGPGIFVEGQVVDGGVNGTKAYAMPCKGISIWGGISVPVKDSVTISFKMKPLMDVPGIIVLVWSEKLQDNGRVMVDGFKKGEWKEVRIKATQLRIGASGDGQVIDHIGSIKIFQLNSAPDAIALIDDFEIRE